ncbi:MAG: NUDIX domain-containing protein [Candidatus Omnitrophica bacterium]|nr:NUDIX domain-containing protein [Candidatus Omnitrophota bacterium]
MKKRYFRILIGVGIMSFGMLLRFYNFDKDNINVLRRVRLSSIRAFLRNKILEENPPTLDSILISQEIKSRLGIEISPLEVRRLVGTLFRHGLISTEYFDVVTDKGEITGILKQRNLVHRDGDWHRAASILVFDENNRLLLQLRASGIAEPNRWEVSASGHVSSGEEFLEAIQDELLEELGLVVNSERIVKMNLIFRKMGSPQTQTDYFDKEGIFHYPSVHINNEFLQLYLLKISLSERVQLEQFIAQGKASGVSAVKSVELEEALGDFRRYPEKYSSAFRHYFSTPSVIEEILKFLGRK